MLYIDFETYSDVDIKLVGAYRYVEDPSFEPLLLSYAKPDREVHVAEGYEILTILRSERDFIGWGNFDRLVLERLGIPYDSYTDAMVLSGEYGWPLKLEHAAVAAKIPVGKDPKGKRLISIFCKPSRSGARVMPADRPEDWAYFREYCRQDTAVMREIHRLCPPVCEREQRLILLDRRINDRGVRVDLPSVRTLAALRDATLVKADQIVAKATGGAVTGIGQVAKLATFCGLPDLRAETVEKAMQDVLLSPARKLALEARQVGAKSSGAKLDAFLASVCADDRCRGVLQVCGAHTRRWAGRLIQPQNMPRDCFGEEDFDRLIQVAPEGPGAVRRAFGIPATASISKALRGLLVPTPGKVFLVVDYSAIESRGLCFLAGQEDALTVYREGGDVYKEMSSAVFKVPVESVTKDQRFVGKVITLACGYQMGWKKLRASLASSGVTTTETQAQEYLSAYRNKYDRVAALWKHLDTAMKSAIRQPGTVFAYYADRRTGRPMAKFRYADGTLSMMLPNGMLLRYHDARVDRVPAPWDPDDTIEAVTTMMRSPAGWMRRSVSGGLICENLTQAVAREIMVDAMLRLDKAGFDIVLTVHDEILAEDADPGRLAEMEAIMRQPPSWAEGLPLDVEGSVMPFRYGKG